MKPQFSFSPKRGGILTRTDVVAVLIFVFLLTSILAAGLRLNRSSARSMLCCDRLRRIAAAMNAYHDFHGTFPPAWTTDALGRPLHSWRVLILPFLDRADLYEKIRLGEAWDSPWNRQFHRAPGIREIFFCPMPAEQNGPSFASDDVANPDSEQDDEQTVPSKNESRADNLPPPENASYSVVIGPGTVFPGPITISRDQIPDGLSETILLVERTRPVCWMDPNQEIPLKAALVEKETDPRARFATMADGSVRNFSPAVDATLWRSLLLRNDRE